MTGETIVITQGHLRFGYHVAKSLTQAGYRVVAMGLSRPRMCERIPGVIDSRVYPEPFSKPLPYVAALDDAYRDHHAALIVPVHEDLFVASYHRDLFSNPGSVAAPEFPALLRVHDKRNLNSLGAASDLRTPHSIEVEPGDVVPQLKPLGFPIILKPRFGEGARGVWRFDNQDQLERNIHVVRAASMREPYIAQQFVAGHGVCIGVLVIDGVCLAVSGHQRLHEIPLSGGTSTARLTFFNPTLEEKVVELVKRAGISGVCMVELRVTPAGAPYLLDINPRYWGGISVALQSGVDIPALHAKAWLKQLPTTQGTHIRPNRLAETRWALGELNVAFALLARRRFVDLWKLYLAWRDPDVIFEDLPHGGGLGLLLCQLSAYFHRWRLHTEQVKAARQDFFAMRLMSQLRNRR